ncbi:MAG TPA: acylphosphatase [Candidatus Krumholzibacteria bacterium]|nr:acylphosphatase [Candidatus Krumholzibacteria bacterium]
MSHRPDSQSTAQLHVWVEGRVQGVMFRESTRRQAEALGLAGWVRNLPDGRVEACFIGPRERCERALAFVRTGPPHADVTRVDARWENVGESRPRTFEIRG